MIVREQNNQLRAFSSFLVESQQRQRQGLTQVLNEQMEQNLFLLANQIDLIRELAIDAKINGVILSHLNDSLTILEQSKRHLCEMACLIEPPTDKRALRKLTKRETDVLCQLADGKSTGETAKILQLTEGSVRTYRGRIMRKLDIYTLPGLVKFAIKHQLIRLD